MKSNAKVCQRPCSCSALTHNTQLLVLTGGPGAGKTAVLELVEKLLCEHVAVLPEAASILFGGGFWRLDSQSGKIAAQRAIYHVQEEMEKLVQDEKKWSMALCDRGTLDGLAYWPKERSDFFAAFETTMEKEFEKYMAVIHLRCPTLEKGYNHQNPVRVESAEIALEIDAKIHEIWKTHPRYFIVESTNDFIEKIRQAAMLIQSFVPECCRGHLQKLGSDANLSS